MKDWAAFFVCLVLSALFWFFHMMSQNYAGLVSVPVIAVSNIEGRARSSVSETMVSARCLSSGYSILRLSLHGRAVPVEINASDFVHDFGDVYSVSATALAAYVPKIFGDGVQLESFMQETFSFKFQEENSKKVPVVADNVLTFRPQYMAVRSISLTPDSVVVYGLPSVLKHIDFIRTRQFILNDIRSNQHGDVRLAAPAGVRLSEEDVTYSLDVTRYVEIPVTVPVQVKNLPAGTDLMVFPKSVDVLCRCVFPLPDNDYDEISFCIDYKEFASSKSGKCLVHCDFCPQSVISYSASPMVFDCFEK